MINMSERKIQDDMHEIREIFGAKAAKQELDWLKNHTDSEKFRGFAYNITEKNN